MWKSTNHSINPSTNHLVIFIGVSIHISGGVVIPIRFTTQTKPPTPIPESSLRFLKRQRQPDRAENAYQKQQQAFHHEAPDARVRALHKFGGFACLLGRGRGGGYGLVFDLPYLLTFPLPGFKSFAGEVVLCLTDQRYAAAGVVLY